MTLKSRVEKLEKQSGNGGLVCLEIPENEDFWTIAERVIDSGEEPEIIDLAKIIAEIQNEGSRLLPGEHEKMEEYINDRSSIALVEVLPNESFENAVQRLKFTGSLPDIIGA